MVLYQKNTQNNTGKNADKECFVFGHDVCVRLYNTIADAKTKSKACMLSIANSA